MRRRFVPLLFAALLALSVAAPAAAARPIHDKFTVDETITGDNLCEIEVSTRVEVNGNVLVFDDGHVADVSLIRLTFTNADGDWLTNFVAGPVFITEQLDGDILTITAVNRGVHEMLRSADGISAAFDRGQITFQNVIDLNDLEDEEDDVLLSSEILFVAGPHPEADAGFELFCEVVADVLG